MIEPQLHILILDFLVISRDSAYVYLCFKMYLVLYFPYSVCGRLVTRKAFLTFLCSLTCVEKQFKILRVFCSWGLLRWSSRRNFDDYARSLGFESLVRWSYIGLFNFFQISLGDSSEFGTVLGIWQLAHPLIYETHNIYQQVKSLEKNFKRILIQLPKKD